jgi:hypothetical protein
MLDQGVWLPPSQFEAAFLSTAHGKDKEVAATIAASTLPAKHEQAGCVQSRIEVASMSEHISVLQRSSALASQYWPSLFLRQRWHGVNLQNRRLLKNSLAYHVSVCINCHLIWFYLLIPAIRKVSPSCFAFNRLKFRYGLFSDKDLLAR